MAAKAPTKTDTSTAGGGTPEVLPRPDFHFPGEMGRTYLESDPARFPKMVQAPAGAPNILLILIDDCVIIIPLPLLVSPKSPRDMTATHAFCLEAAAPSVRCCARTVT